MLLLRSPMRACASRAAAKPFSCAPLSRVAQVAQTLPARSTSRVVTAQGLYSENRASFVHIALNKEIRATRELDDLEIIYQTRSDDMDAINVATFWMRLASNAAEAKRTELLACQQLARRMLGKTLAFVPTLKLRQLANVLYAMGKLRLELSKESLGPHLTEHIEARVDELLDEEGFESSIDLAQLWYGLALLCQCGWSGQLLTRLAAGTIERLEAWESLPGVYSALANMTQLAHSISLTSTQKEDLSRAIGVLTDRVEEEQNTYQVLAGTVWATRSLGLPVSKPLLRRQVNLLLAARRPLPIERNTRTVFSHFFRDCTELGVMPETPAEAQAWFELLEDAGGRSEWSVEEIGWGLGTLASCRAYTPSAQVKQMVLRAAGSRGVRQAAEARARLQLCSTWGIALPAEVRARLVRMRESGGARQ